MSTMPMQQLILLLVGVPPTPSSLRVRVWRRLRSLGAVPLKRSAYLLPDTPERYEDFQWLVREIQREGGDATLIRVQQIENVSQDDVLRLLHEPRDLDYRQLAARYRKVLKKLEQKSSAKSPRVQEELARLAKDHQRIRDVDFFGAPGGAEVRRLEEVVAMRTRRPEPVRRENRPTLDLTKLKGRRWVTRPRPHIDRIVSAWLIKRFIDTDAQFLFAPPAEFPQDAIPFDAPGVELSHQGEDCTFETLVKRASLRDRRLKRLSELVHEADLRDGKYPTKRRAVSMSRCAPSSPPRPTITRSSGRAWRSSKACTPRPPGEEHRDADPVAGRCARSLVATRVHRRRRTGLPPSRRRPNPGPRRSERAGSGRWLPYQGRRPGGRA